MDQSTVVCVKADARGLLTLEKTYPVHSIVTCNGCGKTKIRVEGVYEPMRDHPVVGAINAIKAIVGFKCLSNETDLPIAWDFEHFRYVDENTNELSEITKEEEVVHA